MVDKTEYRQRELRPILASDNISEMVDAIQEALVASNRPVLRRAGTLVEPIYEPRPVRKGSTDMTQVTYLRRLTPSTLSYMVTKHAAFFEKEGRKGTRVRIKPPYDVFNSLLDLGHWHKGIQIVSGVIDAPTMRPDGSILVEAGYDEQTRLWHYQDVHLKPVKVPDRPTNAQAEEALAKLDALLREFPFVEQLDRTVALAAILTVVARGAYPTAPAFLVTAFAAGTGKGFLVELITTILRGYKTTPIAMGASEEEFEKRLSVTLMEGQSIISIDNCERGQEDGGNFLCTMIAEGGHKPRILGRSEMPECDWSGTVFINGNNITYRDDMVRRGMVINLDAQMERPETKTFKFNPVKDVLKNRAEYLAAALTVVRAAYVSEEAKKIKLSPLNGFERWSHFVRRPLMWLGKGDPADCIEKVRAISSAYKDTANALDIIDELMTKKKGAGQAWRAAEVVKAIEEAGFDSETYETFKAMFPSREGRIDGNKLGKWFATIRGGIHGGRRLNWDTQQGGSSVAKGRRWIIEKVAATKAKAK